MIACNFVDNQVEFNKLLLIGLRLSTLSFDERKARRNVEKKAKEFLQLMKK